MQPSRESRSGAAVRWFALLAALVLFALNASCPRADDAPQPNAAAVTAAPVPVPTPAPAPAQSAARRGAAPRNAKIDPATLPTLPPELVDDGSDDVAPPEPDPEPEPEPIHETGPRLASIAKEAWVYTEPRWGSRRIGYLRAGAVVARRSKPSGFGSCEQGWYRIEPKGYVCVGGTATLDLEHPVVQASSNRARRDGLPYTYVMSRFPTPPLYGRLPNAEEQLRAEPELSDFLRKLAKKKKEPEFVEPPPPDPVPVVLLDGHPAPGLANTRRSAEALVLEKAKVRSGFALLSTFDHRERRYGLTTELAIVPIDRTRVIRASTFSGLALDEDVSLPVAFVKTRHAVRYVPGDAGGLRRGEPLGWREAVPLGEAVLELRGLTYWQAKDGTWVPSDQAVRVDRFSNQPSWAAGTRKWIDVSILHQSLVAYVGTKPVYVTLVSTGADGLGDPKKTHSTIQGAFLIHTKHVSVTMDGDDVGDEFDLRDVPFVQYFTEGFALHGAYWHDDFGTPRSHGCINLSPLDAAWLFNWTDPQVPDAWHAALTLKKGTLVYIHP